MALALVGGTVLIGCGGAQAAAPATRPPVAHAPPNPGAVEASALPWIAATMGDIERDCQRGVSEACFGLGEMYRTGDSVPKQPKRAVLLLERACTLNHAVGCYHAALLYDDGDGMQEDNGRAATLYEAGCKLRHGHSCFNLGLMFHSGEAGTKNLARAALAFESACDQGVADGCVDLGHAYALGEGVVKDEARSAAIYQRACDLGLPDACFQARRMSGALGSAAPPHAGIPSFKEKLSRDQIIAASEAAKKRLPPPDQEALRSCRDPRSPDVPPKELLAAASCYRAAGALGMAIVVWKQVVKVARGTREEFEALRNLGPAYEAAGMYHDAARWYLDYAQKDFVIDPGSPASPIDRGLLAKDAPENLTRAICICRQLGDVRCAERGFLDLQQMRGKRSVDPGSLCDSVHPIAP